MNFCSSSGRPHEIAAKRKTGCWKAPLTAPDGKSGGLRVYQWQTNDGGRFLTGIRVNLNRATVRLSDPLSNAQTQPATFDGSLSGLVATHEPIENARLQRCW